MRTMSRSLPRGRSLVRSAARRFPSVARAVGQATAAARSYAGTMSRTKTGTSGPTVTFQRDGVTRYTKHRMPGRLRRRWRSFVRRVNHVALQAQALKTFTRDELDRESWAGNTQAYFGYICGGVDVTGNNELGEAFKDVFGSASTTITRNRNILYMKSLCMDVQMQNAGNSPIVVDVYTLRCRRSFGAASRLAVQFDECFEASTGGPSGSAGSTPDITNPSLTVFQNPQFCQYWQVVKKQELLLGGGNVATFQVRQPTNRRLTGRQLESDAQAIPGYSQALFFMVRGTPETIGEGELATAQLGAGTVNVGIQWTAAFGQVVTGTQTTRQD